MNTLAAIALVAEQKILEAQREGLFDNLPGAGRPLDLDKDGDIPAELRMAHTLLKNGGYIESAGTARETAEKANSAHCAVCESSLLRENPEEAAAHARLRRFRVLAGRLRRSRNAAPLPCAVRDPDLPFDPTLEDSPYLEKLLARL